MEKAKAHPYYTIWYGGIPTKFLQEKRIDSAEIGNCDRVSDVYLQDRFLEEAMTAMPGG